MNKVSADYCLKINKNGVSLEWHLLNRRLAAGNRAVSIVAGFARIHRPPSPRLLPLFVLRTRIAGKV